VSAGTLFDSASAVIHNADLATCV